MGNWVRMYFRRNPFDKRRPPSVSHAALRSRSRDGKSHTTSEHICVCVLILSHKTSQTTTVAAQASVSRSDMSVVTAVRNVGSMYATEHKLLMIVNLTSLYACLEPLYPSLSHRPSCERVYSNLAS